MQVGRSLACNLAPGCVAALITRKLSPTAACCRSYILPNRYSLRLSCGQASKPPQPPSRQPSQRHRRWSRKPPLSDRKRSCPDYGCQALAVASKWADRLSTRPASIAKDAQFTFLVGLRLQKVLFRGQLGLVWACRVARATTAAKAGFVGTQLLKSTVRDLHRSFQALGLPAVLTSGQRYLNATQLRC